MMDIDPIVAALQRGDPVVLPTDTVYGLVAIASNAEAVAGIFEIKQRPIDLLAAVLVADAAQAEEIVDFGDAAHCLALEFWPGALTMVAPRRPNCELAVGDDKTVGVRCPDSELLRAVARRVGPVAATSANLHGQRTAHTAKGVAALLPAVALVVDGGTLRGQASTVVDVSAAMSSILREGPISAEQIAACLHSAS